MSHPCHRHHRPRLERLALSTIVLTAVVLLSSCGAQQRAGSGTKQPPAVPTSATATPPSPSSAPSPAPGTLTASLYDAARSTPCAAGSESDAQCYVLTPTGSSPQLGNVQADPYVDVEVPDTSPLCGAPMSFTEVLRSGAGSITAEVTAPRLCLYATGPTTRSFRVVSGTGSWRGATGSGTITFVVLNTGAREEWQGTLRTAAG